MVPKLIIDNKCMNGLLLQFSCPSCDEAFHVEYLLDKHMTSCHGNQNQNEAPRKPADKLKVEKVRCLRSPKKKKGTPPFSV